MKSKKSSIEKRVMQQSKPVQKDNPDTLKIIDAITSSKKMILITLSEENESKEMSFGLTDSEKLMILEFEIQYLRGKIQKEN